MGRKEEETYNPVEETYPLFSDLTGLSYHRSLPRDCWNNAKNVKIAYNSSISSLLSKTAFNNYHDSESLTGMQMA
ncbi:hypothetical protein CEXT_426421 [Caerostris extrusa]|uniref:Uncharacterized protein n=1 Tax=Caerostris extrusa TaxID=172846 RepID=A0AAV4Y2J7_CAEEX|nr:hypothetical protein CEXT_426421 [Caerostris extrusa]